MSDLPIRKVGDKLRVRDAAGVEHKGVVERVDKKNGTFQLRMPDGHATDDELDCESCAWCFYRNELSDSGLTILGPWVDEPAADCANVPLSFSRKNALQAAVSLAASDNGPNAYDADTVVTWAEAFLNFLEPTKEPA